MEPVRLWRQERVDAGGVRYVRFVYSPYEGGSEWTTVDLPMAALPRAEYDALVKELDDLRRGWDVERLNHMGDLHFIARATGYPYSTTEAQPERAIEIVGAINAIMEARNAATARAERAEALLARTVECIRFYNENQSPMNLELGLLDEIKELLKL